MRGSLPKGRYYFKSNHGSGTNIPVNFPVDRSTKIRLTSKGKYWLGKIHNAHMSLWWYETINRYIYFEEDLSLNDEDAPDWKFFVLNGRVEIYQHDRNRTGDHIQTIYERDGTFIDKELYFKSGAPVAPPPQLPLMVDMAEAIGKFFDFIRVDMFIKDGDVYIGEIGLVPNGAKAQIRTPEIDLRLGEAWRPHWFGDVGSEFPREFYDTKRFPPPRDLSEL